MLSHDRGLVLRTFPLRETSKIVSVLGREHGKLRLVARGARGPRNSSGASLESGNEIEFVFTLKPGRDLGHLREVSLARAWLSGSGRLERLAVGWAALELLERALPEGASEEGLLGDVWNYMEALQHAPERAAAILLLYAFELRLLERFGLTPALDTCGVCGKPPRGGVALDVQGGSGTCARCRVPGSRVVALPGRAAALLKRLRDDPWQAPHLESDIATRREVGVVVHQLLTAHVEGYRYPRALELLKRHADVATPGGAAARRANPLCPLP
jgi:DNA repair protein RecO (recombination protein O)